MRAKIGQIESKILALDLGRINKYEFVTDKENVSITSL